jgi:hypothetical protein
MPDNEDTKKQRAFLMKTLGSFDYIAYRRRNPEREPGTCQWITRHPQFQSWTDTPGFGILWISGDPGCGKSVAASYLVSYLEEAHPSALAAHFFFKDDSDKQSRATSALCAILQQVLQSKELDIRKAAEKIADQGADDETRHFCLWDILVDILSQDLCGSVNIVLDALDECNEGEQERLVSGLTDLGHRLQLSSGRSVKVIVTSRPYAAIRRSFKDFQAITIQADDNLDEIDEDIKAVVASRVRKFASSIGLGREDVLTKIRDKLRTKTDHTFLWISLILDMLDKSEDCSFEEINQLMDNPNPSVEALYERILQKAKNTDKARRMLHIVVGAVEPLTLEEINIAWAVKIGHRLTDEELKERMFLSPKVGVREVCGLFVRIVQGKVVLIHQTAREFLVRTMDNSIPPFVRTTGPTRWKWSLDPRDSSKMLARICATYLMSNIGKLNLYDSGTSLPFPSNADELRIIDAFLAERPFLAHAANHFLTYAQNLPTSQALGLCAELFTRKADYVSWLAIKLRLDPDVILHYIFARATIPADMIQGLVDRGEDINATHDWGCTLLQVAVNMCDCTLVRNPVQSSPDLEKDPVRSGSPLHIAVKQHNHEAARLLVLLTAKFCPTMMPTFDAIHKAIPYMVNILQNNPRNIEDLEVADITRLSE